MVKLGAQRGVTYEGLVRVAFKDVQRLLGDNPAKPVGSRPNCATHAPSCKVGHLSLGFRRGGRERDSGHKDKLSNTLDPKP